MVTVEVDVEVQVEDLEALDEAKVKVLTKTRRQAMLKKEDVRTLLCRETSSRYIRFCEGTDCVAYTEELHGFSSHGSHSQT